MTESKTALAAYLAIHHHKNNLAMMFANPDKKVRLLLSYTLFSLRQDADKLIQCIYYRTIVSECHLGIKKLILQLKDEEISEADAEQMMNMYVDKGTLAHERLMRLTDA